MPRSRSRSGKTPDLYTVIHCRIQFPEKDVTDETPLDTTTTTDATEVAVQATPTAEDPTPQNTPNAGCITPDTVTDPTPMNPGNTGNTPDAGPVVNGLTPAVPVPVEMTRVNPLQISVNRTWHCLGSWLPRVIR